MPPVATELKAPPEHAMVSDISQSRQIRTDARIPARAGAGLKPEHVSEILETKADIGFFEVHAENYMGAGGMPHRQLEAIREVYPLSLHGVGLSIGGEGSLDKDHLQRLAKGNVLSIATGRPGVEALHALRHFKLSEIFSSVITEDDVVDAEKAGGGQLRKPDPFTLNLSMERSGWKGTEKRSDVFYIGDMPDDMTAAINAGIIPIGFVNDGADVSEVEIAGHRDLLVRRGAVKVFGNFEDVVGYLDG